jgi:hypothetical protein
MDGRAQDPRPARIAQDQPVNVGLAGKGASVLGAGAAAGWVVAVVVGAGRVVVVLVGGTGRVVVVVVGSSPAPAAPICVGTRKAPSAKAATNHLRDVRRR